MPVPRRRISFANRQTSLLNRRPLCQSPVSRPFRGFETRGKSRAEQKVLIIGAAGGVGSLAVQIAKALGAEVTGVCSTSKTDLVRSIGANGVINYTRDDFADGLHRYDVSIDTAGRRSLSHIRGALAFDGILVIVGGEGGGRWFGGFDRQMFRAPLLSLFQRQKLTGLSAKIRKADLQFLSELIETGKVTPVIDGTYSLSDVPTAIRHLAEGHARGKIVITV
jgi:NADPH:quinone reductase-like Zn-dependent oxidoreductase